MVWTALAVASPAVIAEGDFLVASFGNNNVLRHDAETGNVIDAFVPTGSGGLDDPEGLAVGPDGHVYVGSYNSNEVLRYDGQTGAFLGAFVGAGSGGLEGPLDLLFVAGKLLVTSFATDQVLAYDASSGAFLGAFVGAGSGGLAGPWALALGPDASLYVTSVDSHQVLRYNGQTGAFLGVFVAAGSGGLDSPQGLTFGPDGHLYVSSYATDEVLRYHGQTGASLGAFVAAGSGFLDRPIDLGFGPDGHLYVASSGSHQVRRYHGGTGGSLDAFVGSHTPTSFLFRVAASTGDCVRDAETACLLGKRFEVKVKMWNFANPPVLFPGFIQTYQGVTSETDQSASFYSFTAGNVEVFVKMVDACDAPDFESFWLFAAGATTAETEIRVRDTVAEQTRIIHNPSGVLFEAVADTGAFHTCNL
jgi:DNA-binding beta-propeller fold protein YncE